jgi:glycolate oxidase FAD binding subunit
VEWNKFIRDAVQRCKQGDPLETNFSTRVNDDNKKTDTRGRSFVTAIDLLPIENRLEPASLKEVAEIVRSAHDASRPLYTIGGGTSLEQGLRSETPGDALDISQLKAVIDYPVRDMTITVEAGASMSALATRLAEHGQELPIDVPFASSATIGGVIASNWNGPRRYGLGTIRDYVVGISAVDGRGVAFKGGGRVVKNVAGYDFCKLLTGSFGSLAVITQVTLKLRPLAESRRAVVTVCENLELAEAILEAQADTQVTLAGLELLAGPEWSGQTAAMCDDLAAPACLVVALLEGSAVEVDWMTGQLEKEWRARGASGIETRTGDPLQSLRESLLSVSASKQWALSLKARLRPSGVTSFVEQVQFVSPDATLQAHAGNGIVLASVPAISDSTGLQRLVDRLQTLAENCGGGAVVHACSAGTELNRKAVWGADASSRMMQSVKRQFDPKNLLNPGRI